MMTLLSRIFRSWRLLKRSHEPDHYDGAGWTIADELHDQRDRFVRVLLSSLLFTRHMLHNRFR
jgi:hypothetical protein